MKETDYVDRLSRITDRLLDILEHYATQSHDIHVENNAQNSNHSHNVSSADNSQDTGTRKSDGAPLVQNDFHGPRY